MKRGMLTLLGLLIISALCTAQARLGNFSQRGNASQEMQTDGLSAAHSSLPIGSKVRVTNTGNGKEIEVTVTGRIAASSDRIIDLSPGAALALDIGFGGPVIVSVPTAPRPRPTPAQTPPVEEPVEVAVAPPPEPEPEPPPAVAAPPPPEPEPEPEPPPAVAVAPPPPPLPPAPPAGPAEPIQVIIHNYITPPPEADESDTEQKRKNRGDDTLDLNYLAWLTMMALDARDARDARERREYRTQPDTSYSLELPHASEQIPYTAPHGVPGSDIIVIGLPDPNSGKLYKLQVGIFPDYENATRAYQLLRDAGFDTVQEQMGGTYRVYARGVPARVVQYAAQRIGVMGFRQVLIRE